jgi:hypothetical protein
MKPISQSFWLPNEPNNAGDLESCATILVNEGPPPDTVLKDDNCDSSFAYICEVNWFYKILDIFSN